MQEELADKIKKNLYLPRWAAEIFDKEAEMFDVKIGEIAAAAILAFHRRSRAQKAKLLIEYHKKQMKI